MSEPKNQKPNSKPSKAKTSSKKRTCPGCGASADNIMWSEAFGHSFCQVCDSELG